METMLKHLDRYTAERRANLNKSEVLLLETSRDEFSDRLAKLMTEDFKFPCKAKSKKMTSANSSDGLPPLYDKAVLIEEYSEGAHPDLVAILSVVKDSRERTRCEIMRK